MFPAMQSQSIFLAILDSNKKLQVKPHFTTTPCVYDLNIHKQPHPSLGLSVPPAKAYENSIITEVGTCA